MSGRHSVDGECPEIVLQRILYPRPSDEPEDNNVSDSLPGHAECEAEVVKIVLSATSRDEG